MGSLLGLYHRSLWTKAEDHRLPWPLCHPMRCLDLVIRKRRVPQQDKEVAECGGSPPSVHRAQLLQKGSAALKSMHPYQGTNQRIHLHSPRHLLPGGWQEQVQAAFPNGCRLRPCRARQKLWLTLPQRATGVWRPDRGESQGVPK